MGIKWNIIETNQHMREGSINVTEVSSLEDTIILKKIWNKANECGMVNRNSKQILPLYKANSIQNLSRDLRRWLKICMDRKAPDAGLSVNYLYKMIFCRSHSLKLLKESFQREYKPTKMISAYETCPNPLWCSLNSQ